MLSRIDRAAGAFGLGLGLLVGSVLLARLIAPPAPTGAVPPPGMVLENKCPDPPGPDRLPWGGGLPAHGTRIDQGLFRAAVTFEGPLDAAGRKPSLDVAVQQVEPVGSGRAMSSRRVGSRDVTIEYPILITGVQDSPTPRKRANDTFAIRGWWREGAGNCQIVIVRLRDERIATALELERLLEGTIAALPRISAAPSAWTFTQPRALQAQLGEIALGLSASDVVSRLGEATFRDVSTQTWYWRRPGGAFVVTFRGASGGRAEVVAVVMTTDADLRSAEGFGPGMTVAEFQQVYQDRVITREDYGRHTRMRAQSKAVAMMATFDDSGRALLIELTGE